MPEVTTVEHRRAASSLRQLLSAYQHAEDLISIGAYQHGSNATVDAAIRFEEPIRLFLRQSANENGSLADAVNGLRQLEDLTNPATVIGLSSCRSGSDRNDFDGIAID
jgi:flagellum-specific ATP synthase